MTKNNHPGKIVIDLDGVIAGPKPESGYADCEVNGLVAQRLRELKALGWTIAINTSRNVKTFEHNVGRITAETVPVIAEFLQRHSVPFDELWPNKPYTGSIGFYVDDRAVRPQEFIELTTSELLAQSRAAVYDPAKPLWRAGNEQSWFAVDLRDDPSPLFRGDLIALIIDRREAGQRAALIIPAFAMISPGQDEELRRHGARWWRFQAGLPASKLLPHVQRDLVLDNLTSHDQELPLVEFTVVDEGVLSSRHFNTVTAKRGRVVKTASSSVLINKKKLNFELDWLTAVRDSSVNPAIVVGGLFELATLDGYAMYHAAGGSLATVLLRRELTELETHFVASELERLWTELNDHNPRLVTEVTNKIKIGTQEQFIEHQELYVKKSRDRVNTLSRLLQDVDAGDCNNYKWSVNGTNVGTVYNVVEKLLTLIAVQRTEHRGVWHGDLCPGNIVLTNDVSHDETVFQLIDPRGTIDGTRLALYGDRRYDLGKLAHALRWGYDGIVAGWYDVQWFADVGYIDVRLRLWDEESNVAPSRLKVWDQLVKSGGITAGTTTLESVEVLAITALQLITCAPLHKDDPKRMMALIARGMQVALQAGVKEGSAVTAPAVKL